MGANRAIAPRSVREQYPPRPDPAEDPLYRRARGSLEKPGQRTDLDRELPRAGFAEYSRPRDEPARFAPTLCRHEWKWTLPFDRRGRHLGALAAQGCASKSRLRLRSRLSEYSPCCGHLLSVPLRGGW